MKTKSNPEHFKSFHSTGLDPFEKESDIIKKIYYHSKSLRILIKDGNLKDKKLSQELKDLSETCEAKLISMGKDCNIPCPAILGFNKTINTMNTNKELFENQITCRMCGLLSRESKYMEVCDKCAASLD